MGSHRTALVALSLLVPAVVPTLCLGQQVSAALRPGPEGQTGLLLAADAPTTKLDRLKVRLPRKLLGAARLAHGPAGWDARVEGKTLVLTGPPTDRLRLRVDLPGRPRLDTLRLEAASGGKSLGSWPKLSVTALPAVETLTSAAGLLTLPIRLRASDRLDLQLLAPERTPAEGQWTICGATARADGDRLRVTLPANLKPGDPVSLRYVDPWGETLVDVPDLAGVEIESSPAATPRAARLLGATDRVIAGGSICVCGWFPDADSWRGLTIDGVPTDPPLAASSHMLMLRLPASLEPGRHTLAGSPSHGYGPDQSIAFTLIRIRGELDRERLWREESTALRLHLDGTDEALLFRLVNSTPQVVSLEGGNDQQVRSSGGSNNIVERTVHAVERGRFAINYELLDVRPCPCAQTDDGASETRTPGDSTTARQPPIDQWMPPEQANGPCEWTTVRFAALAEGLKGFDPAEACRSVRTCIEARRKKAALEAARARRDAARQARDSLERRAERFERYLDSPLAAENQKRFADLKPHYARVRKHYADQRRTADAELRDSQARLDAAKKAAEKAEKACQQARAANETTAARLGKLLDGWKQVEADLARCVDCEGLEALIARLRQALAELRRARAGCQSEALADLRAAVERAGEQAQQAAEKAAADAQAAEARRKGCNDDAARVEQEYQDCFDQALTGTDHVQGQRSSGYHHRRTVRTARGGAALGPVWFGSLGDAARFRRSMEDCLRARENGRTTRPNTLTRRRDLRRCQRAARRAERRAARSQEEARAAAAQLREAQARLDAAERDLGPFDAQEKALAAWIDFLVHAAKDCAQRVERCQAVGEQGEQALAAIAVGCTPSSLRSSAERAARQARRARQRMDVLSRVTCGSGRASSDQAERTAGAVTGPDGSASQAARALERRDEALEQARRLLEEGRCEQAEAAYRRAARAARQAAEACRRGQAQVARAEAAAERAERQAERCEQLEVERANAERQRAAERERRRQQAEQAAERARVERAERRRQEAEDCSRKFERWIQDNLDPDQASEVLAALEQIARRAVDTGVAAGTGVGEAAGQAARGASSRAAGMSGIAAGIINLGASLFYTWMQAELTDAVMRLGTKIDLKYLQVDLINAQGPCGEIRKGKVTYFWIRVGNKFRLFKISRSFGFQYLGDVRGL